MRVSRFVVTALLLITASLAHGLGTHYDEYYSLYQDKRVLERIEIGPDGIPDFSNIEEVETIHSFRKRYDILDDDIYGITKDYVNGDDDIVAINRCALLGEAEPGILCQGSAPEKDEEGREIIQIGLNSGIIQEKTNGLGGNRIRFFLPPGTRGLSLNLHFNSGRGEVPIAYRVGKPLVGPDLQPYSTGTSLDAYEILEDAKDTNAYFMAKVAPIANFMQISTRGNWDEAPQPSEEGAWFYLDYPCATARDAFTLTQLMQIRVHVVKKDFEDWYQKVGTEASGWEWDGLGDPIRKDYDALSDNATSGLICNAVKGIFPELYVVDEDSPLEEVSDYAVAEYDDATGRYELYLPEVKVLDGDSEAFFHDVKVELRVGEGEVSIDPEDRSIAVASKKGEGIFDLYLPELKVIQGGRESFFKDVKREILDVTVLKACSGRASDGNASCVGQ
jgi:hypothetical protein